MDIFKADSHFYDYFLQIVKRSHIKALFITYFSGTIQASLSRLSALAFSIYLHVISEILGTFLSAGSLLTAKLRINAN